MINTKKIRIYNLTDQDNGGFKEEGTQLSLTNLLQKEDSMFMNLIQNV